MHFHGILNHAPIDHPPQISKAGTILALQSSCLINITTLTCSESRNAAQTVMPHPRTVHPTVSPVYTVRIYTIGPIASQSSGKHRHVLTFLDLRTKILIVTPIRSRSEVPQIVLNTLSMIPRHHSRHPSIFIS